MAALVHSLKDVADTLGCGVSTVYTLIGSEKLAAKKMLGKTGVTHEELQRFIAELPPIELGKSHLKGKPRKGNTRSAQRPRRGAA